MRTFNIGFDLILYANPGSDMIGEIVVPAWLDPRKKYLSLCDAQFHWVDPRSTGRSLGPVPVTRTWSGKLDAAVVFVWPATHRICYETREAFNGDGERRVPVIAFRPPPHFISREDSVSNICIGVREEQYHSLPWPNRIEDLANAFKMVGLLS
jgi:hypothetical protein